MARTKSQRPPISRSAFDLGAVLNELAEPLGRAIDHLPRSDRLRHVPSAERFGRVLRQRRQQSRGLVRFLQRLAGIDAKIQQYAEGEAFIAAVETAGGTALLGRAWERAEHLPTIQEIRAPASCSSRSRSRSPAASRRRPGSAVTAWCWPRPRHARSRRTTHPS